MKHSPTRLAYDRAYRERRREKIRVYNKQYYLANQEKLSKRSLEWAKKHSIEMAKRQRKYNKRLRFEMIAAYGGACSCCGEVREPFLTIEHTNHDGREHRAKSGGSREVWKDLKRRGWPKDGYTVFCMNCNWATRLGKPCPHTL